MYTCHLLTRATLPHLERLTRLDSLKIEANRGAAMVDSALQSMNRFQLLRSLTIHKASALTDAGIQVGKQKNKKFFLSYVFSFISLIFIATDWLASAASPGSWLVRAARRRHATARRQLHDRAAVDIVCSMQQDHYRWSLIAGEACELTAAGCCVVPWCAAVGSV